MTKSRRLVAGVALITVVSGLAAIAVTVLLANRSTYPQRILARAASDFLAKGYSPAHVLPGEPVEVTSGGTWITVTDEDGRLLASSATDRGLPVSLVSCREVPQPTADCFFVPKGQMPDTLTVELPSGTRQVLAVSRFSGKAEGYVFAGKEANATSTRLEYTMRLILATWLAGLAAFIVTNRLLSRK